jgi:hypothetical protein
MASSIHYWLNSHWGSKWELLSASLTTVEWCLGRIDQLWDILAVTVVFYEEEHWVTLVVILTLLCSSVNSPLSNQPGGKSQYPISRGGKHIRSYVLCLPPCSILPQLFKCALPSHQMHLCHSHARGLPAWPAALACREAATLVGAFVVYSQTPIIRTFKLSFYRCPPLSLSSPLFSPLLDI